MKKVLTLVLALCLISTCAFAADDLSSIINMDGGYPIVNEPVAVDITLFPQGSAINFDTNVNWMCQYIERYSGLDITWDVIDPASATERFNLIMNSGDFGDVLLGRSLSASQISQYGVAEGMFRPINDLIDAYCPVFTGLLEERPFIRGEITTPDGNIYGWPHLNNDEDTSFRFFLNKEWLERLNLENPTTLAEFEDVLKAFRDNDANGNGDPNDEIPFGGSWNEQYSERRWVWLAYGLPSNGSFIALDYNKEDPDMVFVPYTPEYKKYLYYMNELWNEKLIDPDMFTQPETVVQADVAEGIVGFLGWPSPATYDPRVTGEEGFRDIDLWTAINLLVDEEGDTPVIAGPDPVYTMSMLELNADIDEVAAAAMARFADNCYTVEWYNIARCGPELGSELDWDNVGHYFDEETQSIKYNMSEEWSSSWPYRTSILSIWNVPGFNCNGYKPYVALNAQLYPDTALGKSDAIVKENWQSDLVSKQKPHYVNGIPLMFMNEDQLDAIGNLQTPLVDYVDSMEAKFITGEISIDAEYDNFVKTLESYGVNDLMAVYNEAYATYKANN